MASEAELQQFYIGQDISTVPKPAAILDLAIIRRHCRDMLQTISQLNVGFRAHIKSHKTTQLAHLQVSTSPTLAANFIVSTILELETLLPLLQLFKTQSRPFNVLYGIPLVPSHVPRLADIALHLSVPGSISVMIDHPAQLEHLHQFRSIANFAVGVFLKIDTGYHRAGLPPAALNKSGLVERIVDAERSGAVELLGVYSHSSLSYAGTTPEEAMMHLVREIEGCKDALRLHANLLSSDKGREVVISVGATPQVLSSRYLVLPNGEESPEAAALRKALRVQDISSSLRGRIEFHAGVYPLLDMQQWSTNASTSSSISAPLRNSSLETEVAISILAEVCSIYNDGKRQPPEALLAAGTLALGREPCASYPGWGVISSWRRQTLSDTESRLIVARISQEHAIVSYESGGDERIPLSVGQMVKIFPNHACVAGAFYNHYFVIDSDHDPDAAKIVDVWVRAKGSDEITRRVLHSRNQ
ncbi:hypothetical protein TCE0_041f13661 [Talaromyces pinophilus]|uniref:D-serine dehydratase-like domain-containing protein n=1 Tax=Talaromyces pinophilus TaxID=128442 RepID=A0A6V8HGY3_TALPI|nr:hypothetical protein TCE0_041f13661 [Talaromyces pinophilus]